MRIMILPIFGEWSNMPDRDAKIDK